MSRARGLTDMISTLRHAANAPPKESQVKMSKGAKLKIGGNTVRHDGTKQTKQATASRRKTRRAANARAKAARKANR